MPDARPPMTILIGPPRTGKTTRVLDRYRALLAEGVAAERILLLVPTRLAVEAALDRLMRAADAPPVLVGARILTFENLAHEIVRRHLPRATRMSPLGKRLLLEDIVAGLRERGAFRTYARIAETAGFIDTIGDLLGEFKRQEITPERFAAQLADATADKDRETLAIYSAYQRRLKADERYDAEGEFWQARDLLVEGRREPFHDLRAILLDGFHSFTATQLEILPLLAPVPHEVLCTLPGDAEGRATEPQRHGGERKTDGGTARRADLFHSVQRTVRQLAERFDVTIERVARTPGAGSPLLARLADALFSDEPRPSREPSPPGGEGASEPSPSQGEGRARVEAQARPPEGRGNAVEEARPIHFIEAAGAAGEVTAIARHIKRLVVDEGRRPDDIAVVLRSLADYRPTFDSVFASYGIPYRTSASPSAETIPAVRFVLDCLDVVAANWPWRRVAAVAKSSYMLDTQKRPAETGSGPFDGGGQTPFPVMAFPGDDIELALRHARVAEGYDNYLPALERLAEHLAGEVERRSAVESLPDEADLGDDAAAPPTDPKRLRPAVERARAALPRLVHHLGQWPSEAPRPAFIEATRALVARLNVVEAACVDPLAGDGPRNGLDLARRRDDLLGLVRLEAVLDELAAVHGGDGDTVTLSDYVASLRAALRTVQIDRPQPRTGAVHILDAYQARTLRFPVVFVAGLLERTFPRAHREHPFYGEAERERLRGRDLWLPRRLEDQREEMFLFLMAVTRADERLTLTCPHVDAAGREQVVSGYLDEVRRALGGGALHPPDEEGGGPFFPRAERIGPAVVAPDWPLVASETDLRLRVVNDLWGRVRRPKADRDAAEVGLALLDRHQPTALRTLLRGAAVERERDSSHPVGRWDGVLRDERIVGALRGRFRADRAVSPTRLDGFLTCPFAFFLENVLGVEALPEPLEDFHPLDRGGLLHRVAAAFYRERGMQPPTADDRDEAVRAVLDLAEAQFRYAEGQGLAPVSGLWRVHREEMREVLRRFIDAEIASASDWRPRAVEFAFGRPGEGEPVEITDGERTMRIDGRIDRVDVPADGSAGLRIIDYKSGRADYKVTDSVQLPLYLAAARHLLTADAGETRLSIGYYRLRRPVGPTKAKDEDLDEIIGRAAAAALDALDRIRDGDFALLDDDQDCRNYCPWRQLCRQEAHRLQRKHPTKDPDA